MGVRISLLLLSKRLDIMFKYFKDSYNELVNKVTWPSFEQLMASTKVVLIASVIFALIVLAMDITFEGLMNGVYSLLG